MRTLTFQDIFDTPTDQMANLNTVAQTPDGRIWKYLYATEAITKDMVVTRPAVTGVDTIASSTNGAGKSIYLTEASAGWTTGDYQDHWMVVDDGTGSGQIGKIRDNSPDTLELYEDYALTTALTVAGSSDITIIHEPDAEMCPVNVKYTPVQGVAQTTFASADYGWFLVRGLGGVLLDTTAGTEHDMIVPGGAIEGYGLLMAAGDTLEEITVVGRIIGLSQDAETANLTDVNVL